MRKLFKNVFILLLVVILITQLPIYAFASEANANNTKSEKKLGYVDLPAMKELLETEGYVYNIQLSNHTLSFMFHDGTSAIIEEMFEGCNQILVITEGDRVCRLVFNVDEQIILYNNKPVIITYAISHEDEHASRELHLVGNVYPNIYSETIIRNMTASALYSIMFSAFGGIGVFMSVAVALISGFNDLQSNSKTVYVHRLVYSDDLGTYLHYEDYYYASSNYTNLVTTKYYDKYF